MDGRGCRIPEGLRELCSDISREVLRSQPNDIYSYAADYAEAMVTARANARVAVRTVKSVTLGAERIAEILDETGLSHGQIVIAVPQLQRAFGDYLTATDESPILFDEDEAWTRSGEASGPETSDDDARAIAAATLIQAAYRGYHTRKKLSAEGWRGFSGDASGATGDVRSLRENGDEGFYDNTIRQDRENRSSDRSPSIIDHDRPNIKVEKFQPSVETPTNPGEVGDWGPDAMVKDEDIEN